MSAAPAIPDKEERARRAIEERLGRALHEAEWAAYRERLLAFVNLLRSWEASERGSRSTKDVE